ncbi:MAG TPA: type II toxin-antitoxin system Phd/YefM family antitoxin [Flavobacterium sp.]|nr:type II toxin-antitoxin system Phd/YefM family antitoxin [Flavobacterium sp.]
MLIISSREFRDNQASYLDRVDNGEEILVQRGRNKAYKIIPITQDDTIISKEYILSADKDLERAITGEELLNRIKPRIEKLFDK